MLLCSLILSEANKPISGGFTSLRMVKGKSRLEAPAQPALLNKSLIAFKSVSSMAYSLGHIYTLTAIRSCPFSHGDIYWPHGM